MIGAAVRTTSYLQIRQGHSHSLAGRKLADVLIELFEQQAAYLRKFPDGARYGTLPFVVLNHVPARDLPPWGHEQYEIQADDVLGPRVANWDSSG